MALIKCEECGGQVSDHAQACPHCGWVMASRSEPMSGSSERPRSPGDDPVREQQGRPAESESNAPPTMKASAKTRNVTEEKKSWPAGLEWLAQPTWITMLAIIAFVIASAASRNIFKDPAQEQVDKWREAAGETKQPNPILPGLLPDEWKPKPKNTAEVQR